MKTGLATQRMKLYPRLGRTSSNPCLRDDLRRVYSRSVIQTPMRSISGLDASMRFHLSRLWDFSIAACISITDTVQHSSKRALRTQTHVTHVVLEIPAATNRSGHATPGMSRTFQAEPQHLPSASINAFGVDDKLSLACFVSTDIYFRSLQQTLIWQKLFPALLVFART